MNYQLLTYEEAREILGVKSKKTFYRLVNEGVIPVTRIPGLHPKVRRDLLDQMIEENTTNPLEV